MFDSKFTTYAQLARPDREGIRFVTVRRCGTKLPAAACALPQGYRAMTAGILLEKVLQGGADLTLAPHGCEVALRKRHRLPVLLEALDAVGPTRLP